MISIIIITIGIVLVLCTSMKGLQIEDGTGSGFQTQVNSDNRLATDAVQKTEEHFLNEDRGKVWTLPFEDVTLAAVNDIFFYFKNTSSTVHYNITSIRIASDAVGQVKLLVVSGTAAGGTNITPVNRNLGSSSSVSGIIQSGADITGLTDDGILGFMQLDTIDRQFKLGFGSEIIITPNMAVALIWQPAAGVLTGTVSVNEHLMSHE